MEQTEITCKWQLICPQGPTKEDAKSAKGPCSRHYKSTVYFFSTWLPIQDLWCCPDALWVLLCTKVCQSFPQRRWISQRTRQYLWPAILRTNSWFNVFLQQPHEVRGLNMKQLQKLLECIYITLKSMVYGKGLGTNVQSEGPSNWVIKYL
jgi:hypothetical protein